MPRMNLGDIERKDFTPVPTGKYRLRVTDGDVRQMGENAKEENRGKNMINWECTIQEGEFQGRKVWTNSILTENSIWRLVQMMDACDPSYELDSIDTDEPGEIVENFLKNGGAEFVARVVYVKEDDDKGYDAKNDIKKFFKYGTEEPTGAVSAATGNSMLP